jgi:hypothetical protein
MAASEITITIDLLAMLDFVRSKLLSYDVKKKHGATLFV